MAYLGSTAASSVANPPTCIIPKVIGGLPASSQLTTGLIATNNIYQEAGGAVWLYKSSHGLSDVFNGSFFSDGRQIGMRPGDIVIATQWTTQGSTQRIMIGTVATVSSSGPTALSTGVEAYLSSTRASSI